MALCESLTPEQLAHLLAVSLELRSLSKLAGRLGTVPRGTRIDKLDAWQLSWSLSDYYQGDVEVAKAVDRALSKELGEPKLAAALAAPGGVQAVSALLLESPDPLRDLAWALLCRRDDEGRLAGAQMIQAIIADFDAEEAAHADPGSQHEHDPAAVAAAAADGEPGSAPGVPAPAAALAEPDKELVAETRAARTQRDRALRRSEGLKGRLAEVERALAEARRAHKAAEAARETAEDRATRSDAERAALKSRLDRGLAGELAAASAELEIAKRRLRALEAERDELQASEAGLAARVRVLEAEARAVKPEVEADEARAASGEPVTWNLPVFSDEFYDSIKRWDRKIVRIAFEKIVRLAEDWRHPSLRAIPLEGLPDAWRIRIASDVRLIYRPLDGGRIEILSLIDREDLQRYIRQAK